MPQNPKDILDVLKAERDYLKNGGYDRSLRDPWRAQLIFEDSPTCLNYDRKRVPSACTECVLLQFVPFEHRADKVPCRRIPLNDAGETLFDLYRGGTQQEIEDAVMDWLRKTIAQLEAERGLQKKSVA